MSTTWVYLFDAVQKAQEDCDGSWDAVRGLLGGKGANLGKMSSAGIPVPFGFTLTTKCCLAFQETQKLTDEMWQQTLDALKAVEAKMGKKFGDPEDPLLVSCRSGAKFSMPGMMDTLLNCGLNDANVKKMAEKTSERFAMDAYRRLIQGFGAIVLGIEDEAFEEPLKVYKTQKEYATDVDMTAEDWAQLVVQFKEIIKTEKKIDFPQEPLEQLRMAIGAVFGSWNSTRARAYRNAVGISHSLGTACNIQSMVFGNMGDTSATGVAFTRNPATGEHKFYGEYLKNAQGEDVVAGLRNCTDVNDMGKEFPEAHAALLAVGKQLEGIFCNMQDVEFTIQEEKLWMLQTRDGKRTARSQVRIALEMVEEKLITKETAVSRVSAKDVEILLLPQLSDDEMIAARKDNRIIATGVNASPGGAVGAVVFDSKTAEEWFAEGKKVILVRPFTKPEDVPGFFASKGVLTAEGGATSHAAVVARQFGVPCVCGASSLEIDLGKRQMTTKSGLVVKEGDVISLNASKGEVFSGHISSLEADYDKEKELHTILDWADEIAAREYERGDGKMRGLMVFGNADNGPDALRARKYGAQGIGLTRTEHMFFEKERLPIMQEFILSSNDEEREVALQKLLPFQRADFKAIFEAMHGLPVIIRLLDPPLHEFLPDFDSLLSATSEMKGAGKTETAEYKEKLALLEQVEKLHESNPMMGLRGVRLSIVYPRLVHMQVRAIIEAACEVQSSGKVVFPEIMIPLTTHINELHKIQPECDEEAKLVLSEKKVEVAYKLGTMIETPRAALTAAEIAESAEFFSCGTNDLTQMTFGISRDDAEREFLLKYVSDRILPANPFQTMDEQGVGRLVRLAAHEGRQTRPDLSVGICGEHGGDAQTIALVHKYGLNYVSCSPFRVPAARLAAAHAAMEN
jgi:pyruvate, orthophosphate dikinase